MERIDIVKSKIADQNHAIKENEIQLDHELERKEQRDRTIIYVLKNIQRAKGIKDKFVKELNELQGETNGS